MLDIRCNPVQYQEKLMMQNSNYGPNFGSKNLFHVSFISNSYILLPATILCNLKENWWTKPEKIEKSLISGQFWPTWTKCDSPFHQKYILPLLVTRNCSKLCMHYLINLTSEHGKKPNFGVFA